MSRVCCCCCYGGGSGGVEGNGGVGEGLVVVVERYSTMPYSDIGRQNHLGAIPSNSERQTHAGHQDISHTNIREQECE